jgi:hypothetical protein
VIAASPVIETKSNSEKLVGSPKERVEQARIQTRVLQQAVEQQHARVLSLAEQESDLAHNIEERRSAFEHAQEAVRQLEQEQQRIHSLRAEAAELESRIAILRRRLETAQQARPTGFATEQPLAPQFVDCVQGGVILEPQQVRISFREMSNGVLASLARERGIYFLVRSTGFESFIAARMIARAAGGVSGGVVGYEPKESGAGGQ